MEMQYGTVIMTEEEHTIFFDNFIRKLEDKLGLAPMIDKENRGFYRGNRNVLSKRNRRILQRKFTFRFRRSGCNIKLRFNLRTYKKH